MEHVMYNIWFECIFATWKLCFCCLHSAMRSMAPQHVPVVPEWCYKHVRVCSCPDIGQGGISLDKSCRLQDLHSVQALQSCHWSTKAYMTWQCSARRKWQVHLCFAYCISDFLLAEVMRKLRCKQVQPSFNQTDSSNSSGWMFIAAATVIPSAWTPFKTRHTTMKHGVI